MDTIARSGPARRGERLRHDLRAVWVDGLAWSVMVGMGEQSIPAFAVALGLPVPWGGLVATLPMVAGSFLQLVSPAMVRRIGSHRRWVVLCALVQALSFVPLAAGALLGALPAVALYAVATLYWAGALGTAPAWGTWVGTIVPKRLRVRYFARRSRWLYVLQIVALIAAGWILEAGRGFDEPLRAFAIVFLFALAARALSVACLAAQSEPEPIPAGMRDVRWRELLSRLRRGNDGRLLGYMLAVQFAVCVSGPFYVPYMLRELEFSYAQTMGLFAAAVLAKFLSLPFHARIGERWGLGALLWIGGLGLAPSVALWILTDEFWLLVGAQLFAGFVWSAYELSTFLLFFDAIPAEERTSVLTAYHCANALAIASGSLLGGWILAAAGGDRAAFLVIFAASAVLRIFTFLPLRRVVRAPGGLARP